MEKQHFSTHVTVHLSEPLKIQGEERQSVPGRFVYQDQFTVGVHMTGGPHIDIPWRLITHIEQRRPLALPGDVVRFDDSDFTMDVGASDYTYAYGVDGKSMVPHGRYDIISTPADRPRIDYVNNRWVFAKTDEISGGFDGVTDTRKYTMPLSEYNTMLEHHDIMCDALKWYANTKNWQHIKDGHMGFNDYDPPIAHGDDGKRAKEALSKIGVDPE